MSFWTAPALPPSRPALRFSKGFCHELAADAKAAAAVAPKRRYGAPRRRKGCRTPRRWREVHGPNARPQWAAFTLIELLVVVAIMGIIMTISVPFMHSALAKKKGMNGAVRDVQEACQTARDWAILRQSPQELRIRPRDGVFEVGASSVSSSLDETSRMPSVNLAGDEWRMEDHRPASPAPTAKSGSGSFSTRLPDGVIVEGLGVNGEDWTEDEVARVVFRPNGTCDEMSVILFRSETNERRNIWLEVVTGLSELESDPSKFKAR